MSIVIGQISYLPDNELRSKRLEAATFQLNYLYNLLPNAPIIRVCQNYKGDVGGLVPPCTTIIHDEGIGPAKARNEILREFYHSKCDWLLLVDDDTIWYEYYNYQQLFAEIDDNANFEKFKGIDAISAVEPEYHAFKKDNFSDKGNLTHYKFIPRDLGSGSATTLIRNLRKYYGKELYYPDIDPTTGYGLEDVEFHMQWLKEGLTWYTMQTWIRKSMCFDKSTIWESEATERVAKLKECLKNLCERHKEDGLYMTERNTVAWKDFNNRFNKSQKVLYVPRANPIQFTEKETPKEKPIKNALF